MSESTPPSLPNSTLDDVSLPSFASAGGGANISEWGSSPSPKEAAAAAPPPAAFSRPFLAGFFSGTIMNDAAASCWFNFLFVFLERVQGLSCACGLSLR
jgi:hypothetical protein